MDKNTQRTVEVTFYKDSNGVRGVSAGIIDVKGADTLHPTRITPEEWNEILSAPYSRIQEILSKFY